jgi:hypothetical protein
VIGLTTYQQLLQTIGQLKSVEASLELFSMDTKDEKAELAFKDAFTQAASILQALEIRKLQLEKEEPQYKNF